MPLIEWLQYAHRHIPVPFQKPVRNGLATALVVAVITLFIPNQYKSEARILPGEAKSPGGGMAAAAAMAGVSVPGQDGPDAAYVDIVNSRWMAKKLLMEDYRFTTKAFYLGPRRERRETLYAFLEAKNLDRAIKKMKNILKVTRDLKTKLITITVETPSPELSQQVVQGAVKTLDTFVQVKARTKGGNKATFTAERLKEAEATVAQAEQESLEFLNAHRNYATSNEPTIHLKGARLEANLRLRQQVLATLTLNLEQALLEEKNDMPILNVLDEGDVPLEKSGPPRSTIVILVSFLTATGTLVWLNREGIWGKVKVYG